MLVLAAKDWFMRPVVVENNFVLAIRTVAQPLNERSTIVVIIRLLLLATPLVWKYDVLTGSARVAG
jgi:hypothetical protein